MQVTEGGKLNVIFYKGLYKKIQLSKFDLQSSQTSLNYGKEYNQ